MNKLRSLKEKYHSNEKINQNLNNNNNNSMELDFQTNDENNNININSNIKDIKSKSSIKKPSKRNYIEMKNNELNEQVKNENHSKTIIIHNIDNKSLNKHNNFLFLNNTQNNENDGNYGICSLKKKFLKSQ